MDSLIQYRNMIDIKPIYHKLISPYVKPSKKRIILNHIESVLIYNSKLKSYKIQSD